MPLRFTRKQISSETFETAGVVDVDGDGTLDIVSGGFWYKGPDFKSRFPILAEAKRYRDYYDDFSTIIMDVDGDGRPDVVTGGWWGQNLRYRKNSGNHEFGWGVQPWSEHVLMENIGNVETTRAWDIDGDGKLEIIPNTPNAALCAYKLVGPEKLQKFVLWPEGLGHGLGYGDIDGDGRGEFITPKGILKPPAGGALSGQWTLSDELKVPSDASIPVLVVDIDGDGQNELIVGHSHSYGLDWYKKSDGKWTSHPIDPYCSQYHDLHWVDIDGDGKNELVTGKRYLAHCGHDPGDYDEIGIYYFKWTGEGFAKQVISHGPPGVGAGCGIEFAIADLRKSGRLDIIAPGKDGLQIFYNEGM